MRRFWTYCAWVLIIILLWGSTAFSLTPTATAMMRWDMGDGRAIYRHGGAYQNYEDSTGVWRAIENDFILDGVFKAHKALLKTSVDSVGRMDVAFKYNNIDCEIAMEPYSLTLFRRTDSAWYHIDTTANWNNILHSNNIISWGNVYPGTDMWVMKDNSEANYGIRYKPPFLRVLADTLDQRPDSDDIYLANISRVTLSDGIDNHDIPLGTIPRRVLREFGGLIFQMGEQYLKYHGSDTLPGIPIHQRHIFVGGYLYVLELVKASELIRIHEAYPTTSIWHNIDFTLDNNTDIEDTYIQANAPDNNNDAFNPMITYQTSSFNYALMFKALNVNDSIGPGATFSFAACSLYNSNHTGDARHYCYGVWKPFWVEADVADDTGGVTWNDWESPGNQWTDPGANCAGDDGSFNSSDNPACNASRRDRMATAEDSTNVTGTGWWGWEVTNWAQTAYDASVPISVRIQKEGADGADNYHTRESGGNLGFWVFVYTLSAAETPWLDDIHSIFGPGRIHDISDTTKVHHP